MIDATSFALGRWRGRMGKRCDVRLAPAICVASYVAGWNAGVASRPRRRR